MKILTNQIKKQFIGVLTLTAFVAPVATSAQTSKPKTTVYTQQISQLAVNSACAQTSWKSRGRAPAGYINGMALSYARSLCRIYNTDAKTPARSVMIAASSQNPKKDVLAYYQDAFSTLGIHTNISGFEPLEAVYSLGIGLGMRESSGKYCEGWDVAAGSNKPSSEAEAGLFQTSSNSMTASVELKKLYDEYLAHPERCLLDVYKQGVSCKAQSILGTGAGADYQKFTKSCPAFASEYAMTLLRLLRSHFGPINRKEAQLVPACQSMIKSVHVIVDHDPATVCREIF